MELKDIKKPVLYPLTEVAVQMGISRTKLYRLVAAGKVKAVDMGYNGKKPTYYFTAQAVQDYYDQLQDAPHGTEDKHE